ncbi:unnamed protein product, partial [marine sediment metagenome]
NRRAAQFAALVTQEQDMSKSAVAFVVVVYGGLR